ncbi:MAG: hypothetical protein CVV27_17375 [Candidatus Melainabacteria bacterium HGW-Melainabacteria-1]|nr:MAG: hypothetical protein CVV27_17375 [Candidatus Melainabacteria bacterium HGW-Melainabacteria-1]
MRPEVNIWPGVRRIVQFSLWLLLSACSTENDKPAEAPPSELHPKQEILNWELNSQGNWKLSASRAESKAGLWQLQGLHWQSNGVHIESEKAHEISPQSFLLQSIRLSGTGYEATSPAAGLDLQKKTLSGDAVQLQGSSWSLSAKRFSTSFPMRHWKLNQVQARFQRP